jgi:hypothetical protein
MIDVEMAFLMGAIAASSSLGFIIVVGGSLAQWAVANRKKIPVWLLVFEKVLRARDLLQQKAPTLYDKVYWAILKDVLRSFGRSLIDPVNLARLVGQLVVSFGKAALKEVFGDLLIAFKNVMEGAVEDLVEMPPELESLAPGEYFRQLEQKLSIKSKGQALLGGAGGVLVRGVLHTPGHEAEKLKDVIPTLRKLGAEVSQADAAAIENEINANWKDILDVLAELAEAMKQLPKDED